MDEPADSAPMDDQEHFHCLLRRVREGSEDAAWELVRCYEGYIRRAVRRVLNSNLRPKFDSLDFVQSVWKSFFRMRDEAERFEEPQHLVAFLAGMADIKVRRKVDRYLSKEKCDVRREVPLPDLASRDPQCDGQSDGRELFARQAEPVDVAIAHERWERLVQSQPPHYRQIIALKLRGHTDTEIGMMLDIDPQTVRRFLEKLLQATVA